MDKKQNLRELQTRLAEKLRAVRSGDVTAAAAWLALEAGGGKFLFPLNQSGEIFPWTSMVQVAHTQTWYLGVANLRGSLYGVIDFSSLMTGLAVRVTTQTDQIRSKMRFVTLNSDLNVNCALCVDRLEGLRSTDSFKESKDPADGAPNYFGHVYIDESGDQWQEINLQALTQQDSFLNINA